MLNRDFSKPKREYLNKNKALIIVLALFIVIGIVVTAILYLTNAGFTAGLTSVFMPVFTGIAAIILSTTIYMIATFIVGEAVVEHKSALKSIKDKQNA